jgi:hypothetical protein
MEQRHFTIFSGFAEVCREINTLSVQLSSCQPVIEALLNDQLCLVTSGSMQMRGHPRISKHCALFHVKHLGDEVDGCSVHS